MSTAHLPTDVGERRLFVELAQSLSLEPRELMLRYLERFRVLLEDWQYDDIRGDEQVCIRLAHHHVERAAHCLEMLVREGGPFVCECPGGEDGTDCVCDEPIPYRLSTEKVPPESAGTDRAVDEPATAKKPYSPPILSHLRPDDPRLALALGAILAGEET